MDIVSFIKSNGAQPKADLTELWKRIVFSMAVSNTDDHLRNHGFILTKNGWCLSPMYDVNPIPEGDELSLCINEDDPTISIELAIETAPYFDLSKKAAETMAKEIVLTVRDNWEKLAEKYGFSRSAMERMRPAFAECYQIEF